MTGIHDQLKVHVYSIGDHTCRFGGRPPIDLFQDELQREDEGTFFVTFTVGAGRAAAHDGAAYGSMATYGETVL